MKQPNDPRQGQRWTKATADFRARCKATNAPCWLCSQPINYHAQGRTKDSLEVDHLYPITLRPDLAYDPARSFAGDGDPPPHLHSYIYPIMPLNRQAKYV